VPNRPPRPSRAAARLAFGAAVCAALAAWLAAVPAAGAGKAARPRGTNARTGRASPPLADLVKAARKNDRAALERLAGRLGVARLAEGVRGGDAAIAQAALSALPLARGGVLLVGTVTDQLGAADPALAVAAARTLGALLEGDVPAQLAEWEVPPDVVARACGALRALAARADAPTPSRLAALDGLATAQATCPASADLAPLLRDPAPAVRRAAALVLGPADPAQGAALGAGLADPDVTVSAACAATLCRRVDPGAPRRKPDPLVDRATAAARTLALAPTTPPEDAVEMLACLAASGTPADRASLEKLRAGAPSPLRDRAAELTGGAPPAKTE
jgi:hypothetical protein